MQVLKYQPAGLSQDTLWKTGLKRPSRYLMKE